MRIGYTKAYRKELDSDIWKMPPLYQRVFFYLRQSASWETDLFPTQKGFKIALNPGQLITSLSVIAEGVSWYEYGVKRVPNRKTIKDILGWLESNAMVTVVSNRHGTFIIIMNWDTYNHCGTEKVTPNKQHKVTPKKQSLDTLKEVKEVKELKKKDKNLSAFKNAVDIPVQDGIDFLTTKKKRKLNGSAFKSFMLFWNAFDYKKGKREAADAWYDIPMLTDSLVEVIVIAAKAESDRRPELQRHGKTPKMAQGWLSGARWEDEVECGANNNNDEFKKFEEA